MTDRAREETREDAIRPVPALAGFLLFALVAVACADVELPISSGIF